jgi:hypothetical protein
MNTNFSSANSTSLQHCNSISEAHLSITFLLAGYAHNYSLHPFIQGLFLNLNIPFMQGLFVFFIRKH